MFLTETKLSNFLLGLIAWAEIGFVSIFLFVLLRFLFILMGNGLIICTLLSLRQFVQDI